MVETFDGDYVLYTDHLAAIAEKDKEIKRLRSLVADLTIGCMDNVEVKEDMDRKEKKPKKRQWKFLRTGLKSDFDGYQWEIGKWETTDCERLCVGFNCSSRVVDAMRYVRGEILAEVESSGKCFDDDSKSTHEKMRIVNAWHWRKEDSVELAIYAAEMVIHIFEDKNPYDDRPRKAIEAAKSWLAGKSAYAANVNDAAVDAANAAYTYAYASAASYAANAASAASYAASYASAASYAANAAAYASAADKSVTDKIESWLLERVKHLRRYREAEVGNEVGNWEENKRLERDILMLVRLCLSHGIISRGLACEYLGCAREDLDDMLRVAAEREKDNG